jgi:uncharacterized SAM-binding protein YcdF (DUF218 family)
MSTRERQLGYRTRARRMAVPTAHRKRTSLAGLLRGMALALAFALLGAAGTVVGIGYLVEGFQPPIERSDAIIVISGDENLARLREGIRLWDEGWAPRLVFSGAAREGPVSNAADMRRRALAEGIPESAVLLDEEGADTYGNAVHTRRLMESHGLRSAILVTSPYHLQRAVVTFQGVYGGSGIRIVGRAAPDSDWRKRSWWMRPDLRRLTLTELEKLGYIALTRRYN